MDSTKHCILGTQQFRPRELASQMNLSMDNGWGIIRCIVDYCMGLEDGKYLILKDPNKVLKKTPLKIGTLKWFSDEKLFVIFFT